MDNRRVVVFEFFAVTNIFLILGLIAFSKDELLTFNQCGNFTATQKNGFCNTVLEGQFISRIGLDMKESDLRINHMYILIKQFKNRKEFRYSNGLDFQYIKVDDRTCVLTDKLSAIEKEVQHVSPMDLFLCFSSLRWLICKYQFPSCKYLAELNSFYKRYPCRKACKRYLENESCTNLFPLLNSIYEAYHLCPDIFPRFLGAVTCSYYPQENCDVETKLGTKENEKMKMSNSIKITVIVITLGVVLAIFIATLTIYIRKNRMQKETLTHYQKTPLSDVPISRLHEV